METRGLFRYSVLVSACTLFLVITGSVATTNEDRPMYALGEYHSWTGLAVGLLVLGLAVWLQKVEKRRWVRGLGWAAVAGVAVLAILGLLPDPQPTAVRVAHAFLAQLFFSTVVTIAISTSGSWMRGPSPVEDKSPLRLLAKITPFLVAAQVSLGVAYRQGAMDVLPHIIGALVVTLFILGLAMSVIYRPEHEALRPAGKVLLGVAATQVFLGLTLFSLLSMDLDPVVTIVVNLIHETTGALTLAATVVMSLLVLRTVRAPAKE